jgi:hypothetical protein
MPGRGRGLEVLLGEEAIGMVGWPEVQASIAYLPDFAIGRQLREGVLVTVLDGTNRSGPFRLLWLMIPREVAP